MNVGISRAQLSGLEKFEAPDPAEWCPRGYAVANVDAPGAFESQGNLIEVGTQVISLICRTNHIKPTVLMKRCRKEETDTTP